MSDVWEQLLSSAVLGVERRAFAPPPAEGALGDLIGQLDASDPERALLAAAATVALFQRTGRLAVDRRYAAAGRLRAGRRCRPARRVPRATWR